MFRSFLVLAIVICVLPCQTADAWGRLGKWIRSQRHQSQAQHQSQAYRVSGNRSYAEPTLFGFGIGVGSYPPYGYPRPGQFDPYRFDSYIYDPYQSGSFEPPDLLNDPYFRERHRYDSRFPGRRYRQ